MNWPYNQRNNVVFPPGVTNNNNDNTMNKFIIKLS